jgi:hypothetical protein
MKKTIVGIVLLIFAISHANYMYKQIKKEPNNPFRNGIPYLGYIKLFLMDCLIMIMAAILLFSE